MTNPEDSNKSERSEAPKPRTLPLILVLHQRTVALVVGWAKQITSLGGFPESFEI